MNAKTKGIYLLIVSNTFFGILPILVKIASGMRYSAIEETFFRFLFAVVGISLLWAVGWQKLTFINVRALFWRGFFGSLSIVGYFVALQTTSSGKGTLLNYTYILWANLFSILFFKQKPPKGFFWYFLLAAVGIEMVLEVNWTSPNLGDLAGLFSGITGGAAVLGIKRARYTDSAATVFASFTFFSFILASALLLWGGSMGMSSVNQWITPDFQGLWVLLGIGASSMIAQLFFSEAIGHISLATGTLLTLSVPVLATLFGRFFLNEPLTSHFLAGMILVLIACGMMVWQEERTN